MSAALNEIAIKEALILLKKSDGDKSYVNEKIYCPKGDNNKWEAFTL